MPAYKPLLSEVIEKSESYIEKHGLKAPVYNIEIKRQPDNDGMFNPPVSEFVQLVIDQIYDLDITDRVCIQSFDMETLQLVRQRAPDLTMALLIANNKSFEKNLETLGFKPEIYSPNYRLLSEELVSACREKDMLIIPWTVNDEKDMLRMIELNVDGIITDYPEELVEILGELEIAIK